MIERDLFVPNFFNVMTLYNSTEQLVKMISDIQKICLQGNFFDSNNRGNCTSYLISHHLFPLSYLVGVGKVRALYVTSPRSTQSEKKKITQCKMNNEMRR